MLPSNRNRSTANSTMADNTNTTNTTNNNNLAPRTPQTYPLLLTFQPIYQARTSHATTQEDPALELLNHIAHLRDTITEPEPRDHAILNALLQYCDFTPDRHQSQLLNCRSSRVLLNCPRQWGKSTVAALKAVHRALAYPNSFIVVISRSQRQSNELLRKILRYLPFDPKNVQIERIFDKQSKLATTSSKNPTRRSTATGTGTGTGRRPVTATDITLPNGSRIVALPGREDTTRCFSAVDLLLIDEASRVPTSVYHAVYPMLTHGNHGKGGDIWLMSTPNGKVGFFWQAWSSSSATRPRPQPPTTVPTHSRNLTNARWPLAFEPLNCADTDTEAARLDAALAPGADDHDDDPEDENWTCIAVPATECPRYRKSVLRKARYALGERNFAQEFLCQFTDADGAIFREELVRRAFRPEIKALQL